MNGSDDAFPTPSAARPGLTKREYFASAAMAGLLADHVSRTDAVHFAVVAADALIDELNGVKP